MSQPVPNSPAEPEFQPSTRLLKTVDAELDGYSNPRSLAIARLLQDERQHLTKLAEVPGVSRDSRHAYDSAQSVLSRSQLAVQQLDAGGVLTQGVAHSVLNSVRHKRDLYERNYTNSEGEISAPYDPLHKSISLLDALHAKLDEQSYKKRSPGALHADAGHGHEARPVDMAVKEAAKSFQIDTQILGKLVGRLDQPERVVQLDVSRPEQAVVHKQARMTGS